MASRVRILAHSKRTPPNRIKLVAIAKNEAAYIHEWVFHHLYFGIDAIDIYYNGCTDNSKDLIDSLPSDKVRMIDADGIFEQAQKSPQMTIYKSAIKQAHKDGFGYVLFLDLDEFWVPIDLSTSIKNAIKAVPRFDLLSFQWRDKVDESLFENAILPKITCERSEQVKTIFKAYLRPVGLNPHNTTDAHLIRYFEDGTRFQAINSAQSRVSSNLNTSNACIVHRKYRSQLEYVAMLARGRPNGALKCESMFKNNRHGFGENKALVSFEFPAQHYHAYQSYMEEHLSTSEVSSAIEIARTHVYERYNQLIGQIKDAPKSEQLVLRRVLQRITIPEVMRAYSEFLSKHSNE